jgi:threonine/homoserine/homoserine lactone efflux protein
LSLAFTTDRTLSVGLLYTTLHLPGKQGGQPDRRDNDETATDMTYGENLWLFSTLLFGIIILPGMDMMFVLANALTRGRAAGLAATGGMMLGGLVHSLYGALAVGLLANLVPVLFTPLLVVGALYMTWIGVTLMRSAIVVENVGRADTRSHWEALRRGAVTCLINPKAYMFMLAVYPQFLKPEFGPLAPQAVVMASLTAGMQLLIYGGLAVAAGRARQLLVGNQNATVWIGRGCGAMLVGIAALTLWEALAA